MRQGATLKRRLLSLLLEWLTILGYIVILLGVALFVYFVILDGIPTFNELEMNLLSLTLIGPVVLFSIITEAGKKHATFGKRKMRLAVASFTSDTVKLRQIIVRNIIKFLPWQLAHMAIFHCFALQWELSLFWTVVMVVVNIVPLIWIGFLFRKDHRGIHDLLAQTAVVPSDSILPDRH